MRTSVRSSFIRFTTPLEARVSWMYLDIKALVTTGIGNLIDPVEHALPLPWTHKVGGAKATDAEIRADWQGVKGAPTLATRGFRACDPITQRSMTDADIDTIVLAKLDANEVVLKKAFPSWDSWPADAQMGVLSMAWALGPGFTATSP